MSRRFGRRHDRHTDMNPVTRAILRAEFEKKLTTLKLKLYTTDHGEQAVDMLDDAAFVLAIAGMAIERQFPGDVPTDMLVASRIIKGGISACAQCIKAWDANQAVAIERALDEAVVALKKLETKHLNGAWADAIKAQANAIKQGEKA